MASEPTTALIWALALCEMLSDVAACEKDGAVCVSAELLRDLAATLRLAASASLRADEQEATMRALEEQAKRDWSPADTGDEPC